MAERIFKSFKRFFFEKSHKKYTLNQDLYEDKNILNNIFFESKRIDKNVGNLFLNIHNYLFLQHK